MNSIMVTTFAFVGVLAGVLAQLHVRSRPRWGYLRSKKRRLR